MSTMEPVETLEPSSARPRYDEYEDSGVEWLGEIPAHWSVERLKWTVTDCKNGCWGDSPEGDDSDINTVRVADFDRFALRVPDQEFTVRSVPLKKRDGRVLEPGDLLLEKSGGGDKQPVGVVMLYDLDKTAVCSNFIARMPVADGHDPSFLRYLHGALYEAGLNERAIKQSIGIQNLDADQYLNQEVGLPPLKEQRAIATYLDRETERIDALIEKKEQLVDLLEEKRTALISRVVTKGLGGDVEMQDSGVEWLGEIPAGWEKAKLKFLSESLQTGPFGSQLHSDEYITGGTPVINPSHLVGGKIKPDEEVTVGDDTKEKIIRHELAAGDIVFARRGELGRNALVTETEEGWLCGTGSIRLRPNQERVDPSFLNWVCSTRAVAEWFVLKSVGSTMDNLNTDILGALTVPVPSLTEQRRIARHLREHTSNLDSLKAVVQDGIKKLQEYRTALISAAVTGQIDVRGEVEL